ncbi:unnamed protein product [Absidia cylindrospora]
MKNAPPILDTKNAHERTTKTVSSITRLRKQQLEPHNERSDNDETPVTTKQSDTREEERHDEKNDFENSSQHGDDHVQQQPYSATGNTIKNQQIQNHKGQSDEAGTSVKHQHQNTIPTLSNEDTAEKEASTTVTPTPMPMQEQYHIPAKTFAPLLVSLLLNQNSGLASLGQQCIVSLATTLSSTPIESERADLNRYLVETELYDGVVMGLMDIVHGKPVSNGEDQSGNKDDDNNHDDDDDDDIDAGLSANFSAASINRKSSSTSTGVIRRPSAAPGFESSSMSSSTDDARQGEINLAKMMCLSLISSLTVVLGTNWATEFFLPIVEQLSSDSMFYVRKEAAGAIGSLASVVNADVAVNRLLPLYLQFSHDSIWHVRRSSVLALPLLCGVLPEETKIRIATDGVEIFKNDVSRNVRNTLAEVIGELIAKFLPKDWEVTGRPGKVPDQLLEFFLSLGVSSNSNQMFKMETDRTLTCAYNFPAVILTAGVDYWDSHLKDTYLSLTKEYQIKVRRTFAYSLHSIARIIGPEKTESDLVQIFALYLMDLDDVKQGVLMHLADFLGTLAVSSRNEYIPILAEVWDGVMTNWRLRNILAAQLRDIALLFDAARVVEHVLPLAIRACNDEFAAVRETGVEAFPVILDIVKRAVDDNGETLSHDDADDADDAQENKRNFALALLNHVMERLDEFVRSNMYRGRLVFTQICCSLLEAGISAGDFASFFLSRLAPLAIDEIVNVRIATARAIRQVYLNDEYRHDFTHLVLGDDVENEDVEPSVTRASDLLNQMVYRLALDKDQDVRLFVLDLVDTEQLQEKERELLAMSAEQHNEEDGDAEHEHQQHHDERVQGTPMQDIESAPSFSIPSPPRSTSPSAATSNDTTIPPPAGHSILRRIICEDETTDESHSNNNEYSTDQQQEQEGQYQHQEPIGLGGNKVNDVISDSSNNDTSNHTHISINASLVNNEPIDPNINGSNSDPGNGDSTIDTPMDFMGDDNGNGKKNYHDEDGDELMTDVEHDDDGPELDFGAEKEKGEYIYLEKSTHESIAPNFSSLDTRRDSA